MLNNWPDAKYDLQTESSAYTHDRWGRGTDGRVERSDKNHDQRLNELWRPIKSSSFKVEASRASKHAW